MWVCGEVLVDLFPRPNSAELDGITGGGPKNTAIALSRLNHQVEFIGGISSDQWGQKIKREFDLENVGTRFSKFSDKPTCQAKVTLDSNGAASYEFVIDETATFDFNSEWLPDAYKHKPTLLHIGSLATVVEPGASALFDWALRVSELAPLIFDPNIRPAVIPDREKYKEKFEKWVSISCVIKLSEDDLAWLYPGEDEIELAQKWIAKGSMLVVITRGTDGIEGITKYGIVRVPAVKVDVVDTVGAGDTVGAVIACAIKEFGLDELHDGTLIVTLEKAAFAASITCSRKGANPPTRRELNQE